MLYLSDATPQVLEEYFNKIKKSIIANINDSNKNGFLNIEAKEFLLIELEQIIISKPDELKRLTTIFFEKLNKGALKHKYYLLYVNYLNINVKDRTSFQKMFLKFYSKKIKKIELIFDYEEILSASKSKSYWLAKKINSYTCTYCNRLYANIIEIGNGSNDKKRISRPFFDHWYPKSKYPILALSFYNLIPSCSVCNSSIKGSLNFDIDTHIHPYKKDLLDNFKFSYKHESLTNHNVVIRDFSTLSEKTVKTIQDFKIQEVFDAHSDKELKDLLDLRYKYSDNYIVELFENTFEGLEVSEEEIYRLVFGVENKESDYHKRPFSKFKHDIIEELRSK